MEDENYYIVVCPHCFDKIIINKNEVNCAIFRHGSFKTNLEPIPPHSSKEDCEALLSNKQIYGCSKPFKVIRTEGDILEAIVCDYI
jgi:hypothetical protein